MAKANKQMATPDVALEFHFLKAMYFDADDRPFVGERALPYDAQYNIVVDLLSQVLNLTPCDTRVGHRLLEPGLFEISITCEGGAICEEVGKDRALYGSQLVYAGLFRIGGKMDCDMEQRCASILMPHMKNAVDKFIYFSGMPRRFGWRFI